MNKTTIPVRKFFTRYFLILSIVSVGVSCRKNIAPPAIPQLVKTTEVKEHGGLYSVSYPGKIQAASDVKLAFRVAGPIIRFYAKEGAFVKKGEVLAEIDPRDYKLQYDATEAEYNQVKGEAERIIELYKSGSVSVNDYDKAVAAIGRVTALYNAHKNALQDTRLKAPFPGYVQKTYFDNYEIVNQGLPVLSMIDNDYFEIDIDIPASDYIRRENFIDYYCVLDIYPGKSLPLELLDINQKANLNQLFKVRFRLKKSESLKLAAGMSASVTINYTPSAQELAEIPISALFQEEGKSYAWLYNDKDSIIQKIPVEVQQVLKDGNVIVKSDLRRGQSVVSAGVNSLKEGQQVKKLTIPASNIGGLL